MSNLIQIKRSETTATPPSLANGELAWSSNGDVLFIGDFGSVTAIGGKRYPGTLTASQALVANSTSFIDEVKAGAFTVTGAITANGTSGTDGQVLTSNGTVSYWASPASSSFTLAADAGSSDTFNTGETLTFAGGNGANTTVSDNQISIAVTAGDGVASNATGVHVVAGNSQVVSNTSGVFIDETNISLTNLSGYDANEHVDHSSVSVTAGDGLTGGGDLTATRDFAVGAGNGITVNADDVAVTAGDGIAANSTGVHVVAGTGVTSNSSGVYIGQAVGTSDNVTFNDITATGNLNVTGTLTTIDTTNLVVQDPLIKLANGNVSTDALDIGFFGVYDPAGTDLYAGLFRDATDGKFRLFKDSQVQPTTTVDTGGTGYTVATLVAALESSSATITGGTITGITDLAVADGGTGASSFTDNGIIYGNGASALSVTSAGTEGQVLQAGSGGVPEFGSLDGGTF